MRYGYYVRTELNYPKISALTKRAERMGFESAHVNDHLIGFDEKQDKKEPYLEALMLMSALAIETKKIKLGHIVLCNSFRIPAYLAKMISTLDHISNGRALLWLGAGWYEEEYKAYSIPFVNPKQRVDELEESLTIYKKLFTEESTDFKGKFWTLENNRNYPKPVQKPYPQIVLGTTGKRMTEIACRDVDGINLPYVKPDDLPKSIEVIKEHLTKYKRDPKTFEISYFGVINIVESQEELDKLVQTIIERAPEDKKPTKADILRNQFIGFPEDIKEKIDIVENMGIDKIVIAVRKSETIDDPLKLFVDKIM